MLTKVENLVKFIELSEVRRSAKTCVFIGTDSNRDVFCSDFTCDDCPLDNKNISTMKIFINDNQITKPNKNY